MFLVIVALSVDQFLARLCNLGLAQGQTDREAGMRGLDRVLQRTYVGSPGLDFQFKRGRRLTERDTVRCLLYLRR